MTLAHECAPGVSPRVLQAVVRAESGFDPLALHVNGGTRLSSAPRTAAEAVAWSMWLIQRGYSVDMGLMQINSGNLARLRTTVAQVFEPCHNLAAGAAILAGRYNEAMRVYGTGEQALLHALSAYNTGNFLGGLRNGYVVRVMKNVTGTRFAGLVDLTCLLSSCPARSQRPVLTVDPYRADSVVVGWESR